MSKHQIYESCENFINKLYVNYPRLFKSLNEIISQYQTNPTISKTFITQSLLNLLKDDPSLEGQLYELLFPPPEVIKPYTLENVQNQITEAFKMIQNKKPDAILNLIAFFQEKTRNQNNQTDPMEIRAKALECFHDFFKDETVLCAEIANCFELESEKKGKTLEKKNNEDLAGMPKKKRKLDNFKEKIILTPSKTELTMENSKFSKNIMHFHQQHHQSKNFMNFSSSTPEETFFNNLKNRLTEQQYNYFFKMFFLYLENIISNKELFTMIASLFPDESVFLYFRNLLLSREVAHRKAAIYFKPYCDIDLSSKKFFFFFLNYFF